MFACTSMRCLLGAHVPVHVCPTGCWLHGQHVRWPVSFRPTVHPALISRKKTTERGNFEAPLFPPLLLQSLVLCVFGLIKAWTPPDRPADLCVWPLPTPTPTVQGGFAKCYELNDIESHRQYAGKIVEKKMLAKYRAKEKVRPAGYMCGYRVPVTFMVWAWGCMSTCTCVLPLFDLRCSLCRSCVFAVCCCVFECNTASIQYGWVAGGVTNYPCIPVACDFQPCAGSNKVVRRSTCPLPSLPALTLVVSSGTVSSPQHPHPPLPPHNHPPLPCPHSSPLKSRFTVR